MQVTIVMYFLVSLQKTSWQKHRTTCRLLDNEVILRITRLIFPSIYRVSNACLLWIKRVTIRPPSVRWCAAVVPSYRTSTARYDLVETKPVISYFNVNSASHNIHTSQIKTQANRLLEINLATLLVELRNYAPSGHNIGHSRDVQNVALLTIILFWTAIKN